MEFRATKEYAKFREQLDNHQLSRFRSQVSNLLDFMRLEEGVHTVIEADKQKPFQIHVYLSGNRFWLLGGHWVRKGEPTLDFKLRMEKSVLALKLGKEPE